jgi:hypothetical protein
MPGRDGTGPLGQGAQTGKGRGKCATNTSEESVNFKRGRRHRLHPVNPENVNEDRGHMHGHMGRNRSGRGMGRGNRAGRIQNQ